MLLLHGLAESCHLGHHHALSEGVVSGCLRLKHAARREARHLGLQEAILLLLLGESGLLGCNKTGHLRLHAAEACHLWVHHRHGSVHEGIVGCLLLEVMLRGRACLWIEHVWLLGFDGREEVGKGLFGRGR